jgi:hypothetical protein
VRSDFDRLGTAHCVFLEFPLERFLTADDRLEGYRDPWRE